jgi:transposase-like protein
VSQKIEDKADAAEARTHETRGFMQQVRVAAKRKYTPEEKVRIVLEGFRREVTVRDLCRREGIKPGAFYAWTSDFMIAGTAAGWSKPQSVYELLYQIVPLLLTKYNFIKNWTLAQT